MSDRTLPMTEQVPTPMPWVAEPEYEDGPPNFIHKEGHPIADCNMGNGAEDDANAALIVEAVNSYASLKEKVAWWEEQCRQLMAEKEASKARTSPVSANVMTTYSDLPEAIRDDLVALEMFIGGCDGQWTALQTSDANVVLDNGTIDASDAVKAFNGIVAALRRPGVAQTPHKFPYQQTFDAIAAAVSLYPDKHDPSGISISVRKFEEAFNGHRDAGPDTSTDRTSK